MAATPSLSFARPLGVPKPANGTGTGLGSPEMGRIFRAEALSSHTLIQWPARRNEDAQTHFAALGIRPRGVERRAASRFATPPFGAETVMQALITFAAASRLRAAHLA